MGRISGAKISSGSMVMQPTANLEGSASSAATAVGGPGFQPPTHTAAVDCFTTRPLRVLQ